MENRDERRVGGVLALAEHRAAALVTLGLPGMRFLYEGQLTGARLKAPVQLGRLPVEAPQPDVQQMYRLMLHALTRPVVGRGQGEVVIAKLGSAYHKSLRLDVWLWLPGLLYYVWLKRIIWLGAEFGTPAGQMRGLRFFVCQGAVFWLAVLGVYGLLATSRSRV